MITGLIILWHKKWRLFMSVAGIAIAVAIIFVEQGFFYGIVNAQARIATKVNGDLVLMHRNRTHLEKWNSFEGIHGFRAMAVPGVTSVIPVYKGNVGLRNKETGRVKRILVYAFPSDTLPLIIGNARDVLPKLRQDGAVLFDTKSRDIYGQIEAGDDLELDGKTYRLAGFVEIGPNVLNDGALVMSQGTWRRSYPDASPMMAVVQLARDADVETVRSQLTDMLPDLSVMTPIELAQREKTFTANSLPIGIVFGVGMMAGLLIGLVVCYQVLFNQLNDLKPQYATLIAMGFSASFLRQLVLGQALLLSLAGYALAIPLVWLVFEHLSRQTALIIALEIHRSLEVFGLTLVICIIAALLAVRPILTTDPAELY